MHVRTFPVVPPAPHRSVACGRQASAAAEIDSTRLLQGQREIRIRHRGELYRLLHTRNDKLILTK